MLCENCHQNEASIHYTEIINGVKKEHHICMDCARRLNFAGMSDSSDAEFPFVRLLTGLLGYTVMMFRYFGQVEGCFVFALLIVNAMSSSFDTIVENILYWKRNYISSFEGSKNRAQQGGIKLTDTQEIQLPEKYRYNTPPIDGKVKRHKRRPALISRPGEAQPHHEQLEQPERSEPSINPEKEDSDE